MLTSLVHSFENSLNSELSLTLEPLTLPSCHQISLLLPALLHTALYPLLFCTLPIWQYFRVMARYSASSTMSVLAQLLLCLPGTASLRLGDLLPPFPFINLFCHLASNYNTRKVPDVLKLLVINHFYAQPIFLIAPS